MIRRYTHKIKNLFDMQVGISTHSYTKWNKIAKKTTCYTSGAATNTYEKGDEGKKEMMKDRKQNYSHQIISFTYPPYGDGTWFICDVILHNSLRLCG